MIYVLHYHIAVVQTLLCFQGFSIERESAAALLFEPAYISRESALARTVMTDDRNYAVRGQFKLRDIYSVLAVLVGEDKIFEGKLGALRGIAAAGKFYFRKRQGSYPHSFGIIEGKRFQFLRTQLFYSFSVVENYHSVGKLAQKIQPVLGNYYRFPLQFPMRKCFAELFYRLAVKIGGRLVKHDDVG